MNEILPKNKFIVPTRWLMAGITIYNVFALWYMKDWASTNPVIGGRYSISLAMGISLVILMEVFWLVSVLFFSQQFEKILKQIPQKYRLVLLGGLGLFVLWWLGQAYRVELMNIIAFNVVTFAAIIILGLDDRPFPTRILRWMLLALTVFVFFITFISVMVDRPYSPDEALWASGAISVFVHGGLYLQVAFTKAYPIAPGLSWVTAIYGWLLQNFAYDLQIGRIMQFVIYTMTVAAIGLFGTTLYNRRVGLVAMLIVFLSRIYYPIADYRPDHFVALGQMLAFTTMILARKNKNPRVQIFLHGLTGLLITLSMQLHAAAIVFVLCLSLFYTGDFIWSLWRGRKLSVDSLRPILSFGVGAFIGTSSYFVFNILPVGGLNVYLDVLIHERASTGLHVKLPIYFNWFYFELLLVYAGLVYLIWRRSSEDKLYLALLICWIIALPIDAQGYAIPYRGLFIVPIALFLVEGFKTFSEQKEWHLRQIAVLFIIFMALLGQRFYFIHWDAVAQTLREGRIPPHNSVAFAYGVVEHLEDEDWNRVLVGTHELIWALKGQDNFYSPMAEGQAKTQRAWQGTEVWDFLQPDLYIEAPTRLVTPPGLRAYLDREGFQVCEEFHSLGEPVRIYRRECPEN